MNASFIKTLSELLVEYYNIYTLDSDGVKRLLVSNEDTDNFPMICFEYTEDSDFEVSIDESKFLNDPSHNGIWILGEGDPAGTVHFAMCLQSNEHNHILNIDVFEVNENMRGEGIGGNIVTMVENIAADYYNAIEISPFDTSAINFWEHMEYSDKGNGLWHKDLE